MWFSSLKHSIIYYLEFFFLKMKKGTYKKKIPILLTVTFNKKIIMLTELLLRKQRAGRKTRLNTT